MQPTVDRPGMDHVLWRLWRTTAIGSTIAIALILLFPRLASFLWNFDYTRDESMDQLSRLAIGFFGIMIIYYSPPVMRRIVRCGMKLVRADGGRRAGG